MGSTQKTLGGSRTCQNEGEWVMGHKMLKNKLSFDSNSQFCILKNVPISQSGARPQNSILKWSLAGADSVSTCVATLDRWRGPM